MSSEHKIRYNAETALAMAKKARAAAWTARVWGELDAEQRALAAAREWEQIAVHEGERDET